jgi:DNA polymerase
MIEADFETRSDIDLKAHGAHVYFESPRARVLLGSFRIGDLRLRWRFGQPCPEALQHNIRAGAMITAHNASFEILCFKWLHEHCGWPAVPLEQFRCTAATAAAMQLPRSLDRLAVALNLSAKKDKDGMRLIRKFSIPKKDGTFTEPEDDPADFDRFHDYCDQDVAAEAEADTRLVPLSDREQAVYTLTERINHRGVRIDAESARRALLIVAKAKDALDAEMAEVTAGVVRKCSEVGKLTAWLEGQGVPVESLAKADLEELLEFDDLPALARRALVIRQEAAKTSTAKLATMLNRASRDGRVRGEAIYHAAGTGRTQSAGVNLNNLPRPRKMFEDAKLRQDVLFASIRAGDPDYLRFLYGGKLGRPLNLLSDSIRGFIWAAPDHDLIQADYSNIEGSIIAWLAGEEWKLAAIQAIFADPSIPDLYRQTAAGILGLPLEEVTKKHWARQAVGKPAELGLGFQGGVNAFYTFARNGGVDLRTIAAPVLATATEEQKEKALKRYLANHKRNRARARELPQDVWMACEIIKVGWRTQNAAIAASWHALEAATREAVETPGVIAEAARVHYISRFGYLWARLPSGRCLCYGAPRLKEQVWAEIKLEDGSWSDAEVMDRDAAERGELKGEVRIQGGTSDKVTGMTVNSQTKQWTRTALYGGLLCENNTQGTARDVLVNGMFKAEAAGYPIILTVYDEIIAEVPRGFGDLKDFERLICELPAWADGLPVAAGGWRGKRYRKD